MFLTADNADEIRESIQERIRARPRIVHDRTARLALIPPRRTLAPPLRRRPLPRASPRKVARTPRLRARVDPGAAVRTRHHHNVRFVARHVARAPSPSLGRAALRPAAFFAEGEREVRVAHLLL